MNKDKIVKKVAKKYNFTQADVRNVIDSALDEIVNCIANGEDTVLVGFGKFSSEYKAPRPVFNVQTQKMDLTIPKVKVKFYPGTRFKEALDESLSLYDDSEK